MPGRAIADKMHAMTFRMNVKACASERSERATANVNIYNEVERRLTDMISRGVIVNVTELHNARALMWQGVYVTLITAAANWSEVVNWIDEIK